MTDKLTPKQELILTLDAAWKLVELSNAPPVGFSLRLVQLRGLLDHARALALRVGSVSKPRKEKSA